MKENYTNSEEVLNDLELMFKAGLIDVKMREDGEWLYSASDYSKSLSEEELFRIIDNLHL